MIQSGRDGSASIFLRNRPINTSIVRLSEAHRRQQDIASFEENKGRLEAEIRDHLEQVKAARLAKARKHLPVVAS